MAIRHIWRVTNGLDNAEVLEKYCYCHRWPVLLFDAPITDTFSDIQTNSVKLGYNLACPELFIITEFDG